MRTVKKVVFLVDTTTPETDLTNIFTAAGQAEGFTVTQWNHPSYSEFDLYFKFVEDE